jgi:hypothetical protein
MTSAQHSDGWEGLPIARLRGFNTYLEWDRGFRGCLVVWFATSALALVLHLVDLVGVGRTGSVRRSAFQLPASSHLEVTAQLACLT